MAAEHLLIGEAFNPEVGYVRRKDFRRSFGQARFSPRPKNSRVVRRYNYTGSVDYITNADLSTHLETEVRGAFSAELQSGDSASATYTRNYELLDRAFSINPGTIVPAGAYNYQNLNVSYSRGQQRMVSGRIFVSHTDRCTKARRRRRATAAGSPSFRSSRSSRASRSTGCASPTTTATSRRR